MSEMAKTIVFVAVATVLLLAAFVLGPGGDTFDVKELVGERLNQFEVGDAKRLKIIKFDSETATTREFEVAENDGLWTIPSKRNYPADATSRMAEAATCVIDREVLRIAAESASEHEKLGVVDPTSSKIDSKSQGVGTRVILTDGSGETLADMIIGNEVVDAEGQRYVRNANQDLVYVVALNPDKLSTRFDDWIEDDLLKLNPLDFRRVHIKDYSAEMQHVLTQRGIQRQIGWDRRGEMTLRYDNDESKWLAQRLQKYDHEKESLVDYELVEDEELNEDALNQLRDALDDLKLVDVERKPAGLSTDLKAGSDFLQDEEAVKNLADRGFAAVALSADPDAESEILSSEGELTCTMSDGIEYVLRFGNLQMKSEGEVDESAASSEEESQKSDDGVHRYLFVMARFNEAMIERPELEELPSLPEDAAKDKDENDSEEDKAEEDKAEEDKAEEDKVKEDEAGESDEQVAEEGKEEEEEEGKQPSEDSEQEDSDSDASPEDDSPKEESSDQEEPSELENIIAQRKSIEEKNQRLLDEYQEKISSGQDRVKELNERFGDWYYVIANDVYKQIHLGRDQVIRKKEKPEGEENAAENASQENNPLSGLPNLPLNDSAAKEE